MPARSPEETHALLAEAVNAGDLDAFVRVYEENATLIVPPEGALVNGREEIRRALEPTFALSASTSSSDSRATGWP
jgi:ketosteroid isomerase-like protein